MKVVIIYKKLLITDSHNKLSSCYSTMVHVILYYYC